MDLHKVNEIYQEKKGKILRKLTSQENPLAFILGGQPASGKSKLAKEFTSKFSNNNILFVNGDIYREFHPNRQELILNSNHREVNRQYYPTEQLRQSNAIKKNDSTHKA